MVKKNNPKPEIRNLKSIGGKNMLKRRNILFTLLAALMVLAFALAACGGSETPAEAPPPTQAPAVLPTANPTDVAAEQPAEQPGGLTCAEPVKVGLITDETGALAIYGAHILRGFPLGMEYATGSEGVASGAYTSYTLDGCEFQVVTIQV
jgi:predicted small lipoprotein YifL